MDSLWFLIFVCCLEVVTNNQCERVILQRTVADWKCTLAINVNKTAIIVETSEVMLLVGETCTKCNSSIKWLYVVAAIRADVLLTENSVFISCENVVRDVKILRCCEGLVACEVKRTKVVAIKFVFN